MELVCSLQLVPSPGHQLIHFPGCVFLLAWIWPTTPAKGRQLASAWWPGKVWNPSSLAFWEIKLLHEMMRNLSKTEKWNEWRNSEIEAEWQLETQKEVIEGMTEGMLVFLLFVHCGPFPSWYIPLTSLYCLVCDQRSADAQLRQNEKYLP